MKNITLIIGARSNLSNALKAEIKNSILISTNSILKSLTELVLEQYCQVNIIFNQFQVSTELNNINNPLEYINMSIQSTAEVLSYIKNNNINIKKVIYSSSSSIYGNNAACSENDIPSPSNLHASLKLANENLVALFCKQENINYTITRIFNMYGNKDKFSIISKIIHAYKTKDRLTIINNGESLRDYIHIKDVVKSYKILLKTKNIPIINIGSGEGKSLLFILHCLEKKGIYLNLDYKKQKELKISISQNILLTQLVNFNFVKVEEYLLEYLINDKSH